MSLLNVPAGKDVPNDVYVIVENVANAAGIKYEVDKDTGALFVDRFAPMPMVYPAHYGYINHTLGGDGDPIDAFVYTDIAVLPGSVVRCRPIAVLHTEDESGTDPKVICVPVTKLDRRFESVAELSDLPVLFKEQLEEFYKHYKNLEKGKWVKVSGWGNAAEAKAVIVDGVNNHAK
ncbi:MAG: inorganic diphosphatase [Alphaproteobacteria bacterium]